MGDSNEARKILTTKSIEDKVLVLEDIASKVRPYVDGLPSSMNEFRGWEDAALGVRKIRSPSSTNKKLAPHNESLVDRANTAMERVQSMKASRKLRVYISVTQQLKKLETTKVDLEEDNRRLVSELLTFKHRHDVASERLAQAKIDLDVARRDLGALRIEFLNATNTKPRRVK